MHLSIHLFGLFIIRSYISSCLHLFIYLFTRFFYSFMHPFIPGWDHSSIYCDRWWIYSFLQLLIPSCVSWFIHLVNSIWLCPIIYAFTRAFIQQHPWFIPSIIRSFPTFNFCYMPGNNAGGHRPTLFDGLLSKSAKAALEEYKRKESETVGSLEAKAKEQTTFARSQLAAVSFAFHCWFCVLSRAEFSFYFFPVVILVSCSIVFRCTSMSTTNLLHFFWYTIICTLTGYLCRFS